MWGNCLGGAGLLVSSCVFQARGNGVGKDVAPYGANESWEHFQQQQILVQLSSHLATVPTPSMDQAAPADPAWRPC